MKTLQEKYAEMSNAEFLSAFREATLSLELTSKALVQEMYRRFCSLLPAAPAEPEGSSVCTHLHTSSLSGDTICDVSHEHCACGADYSKCCILQP